YRFVRTSWRRETPRNGDLVKHLDALALAYRRPMLDTAALDYSTGLLFAYDPRTTIRTAFLPRFSVARRTRRSLWWPSSSTKKRYRPGDSGIGKLSIQVRLSRQRLKICIASASAPGLWSTSNMIADLSRPERAAACSPMTANRVKLPGLSS